MAVHYPGAKNIAANADTFRGHARLKLPPALPVPAGFLLSLPFTTRFTRLSDGQRDPYLASLVLAAVATALLVGPTAYHRLVFRQGQKERLVRTASLMAIGGLAAVSLAVSAAVFLVTSYVADGLPAALITAFVACLFGLLWFMLPLAQRRLRCLPQDRSAAQHCLGLGGVLGAPVIGDLAVTELEVVVQVHLRALASAA